MSRFDPVSFKRGYAAAHNKRTPIVARFDRQRLEESGDYEYADRHASMAIEGRSMVHPDLNDPA